MHTKEYIQATYEVLKKGDNPARTLLNLKAKLALRGLLGQYPKILRGLLEKFRRHAHLREVEIILARAGDEKKHRAEIHKHLEGYEGETTITINTHIIGGYIIKKDGKRIDASYKHKLLQTYQRLTD